MHGAALRPGSRTLPEQKPGCFDKSPSQIKTAAKPPVRDGFTVVLSGWKYPRAEAHVLRVGMDAAALTLTHQLALQK